MAGRAAAALICRWRPWDLLLQTTLLLLFGAGLRALDRSGPGLCRHLRRLPQSADAGSGGMQARLGRGPWERLVQLSQKARVIMANGSPAAAARCSPSRACWHRCWGLSRPLPSG